MQSSLATGVQSTTDYSSRQGATVDHFIIHHSADTNQGNVLAAMAPGGRTVSANYSLKDKSLVLVVDEAYRAFTSGSPDDGGAGAAWDRRSITIEVCNSVYGDPWPVSDESFDTLARLIADVASRYGFPINDNTVLTHQELWARFSASYPTACPGDLQRRKAELLALALNYQAGVTEPVVDNALLRRQKEDTMYVKSAHNPEVYCVSTGANNQVQFRLCDGNEAAFAIKGGLVVVAGPDKAGDDTLEALGRAGGYLEQIIPTVKLDTGK